VFLWCLNRPQAGAGGPWPAWGRLTLGVYMFHMLLAENVSAWLQRPHNLLWDIPTVLAVLAASLLFAGVLARRRRTAWLVC